MHPGFEAAVSSDPMASIDEDLVAGLRRALGLRRAVETGTHLGAGARRLATAFDEVITIELSPPLAERARQNLRDLGVRVCVKQGHSARVLVELRARVATLWFLDGHWSGGFTEGRDDECPVLAELAAVQGGHPDDVVIIDDARLFAAAPPPPHDPAHWPDLVEVLDVLRRGWPGHHVTVINDQILAVPQAGRAAVDEYAHRLATAAAPGIRQSVRHTLGSLLSPLRRG